MRFQRLGSPIRLLALAALAACAAPPTAAPTPTSTPLPVTATALPPTATPPGTSAEPANAPVPATSIALSGPNAVAVDADGNLYLTTCDQRGPQLYKIDRLGLLTVFASRFSSHVASGDGGPALKAGIGCPAGLTFDAEGNLYVTDEWNNRIRRIDRNGIISTVAGSGAADLPGGYAGDGGPATAARLNDPNDVAFDSSGNLYIADFFNNRIRRVDKQGIITTVAGTGAAGFSGDGGPATLAMLNGPSNVAVDVQGNLYISDVNNARIRKVNAQGMIITLAGTGETGTAGDNGPAAAATLSRPQGLAFDAEGNLYVACTPSVTTFDARIRKIDQNGNITTVVGTGALDYSGDGGPATAATLRQPAGLAFDHQGNLYVVDWGNNVVREVDKQGLIKTVVGGRP